MKEKLTDIDSRHLINAEELYRQFTEEKDQQKKRILFRQALQQGSFSAFIYHDLYLKKRLERDFSYAGLLIKNAERCVSYHQSLGSILLAKVYFFIAARYWLNDIYYKAKESIQLMNDAFDKAIRDLPKSGKALAINQELLSILEHFPITTDGINSLRQYLVNKLPFPNSFQDTCAGAASAIMPKV